jgi:hypothetical protein
MTASDPVRTFLAERGLAEEILADGVEGLVARWEQAAREAERERYPFGIEDWLNELDGRQLLHELVRAVPQALDVGLDARLADADLRLRAATELAPACVWGDALAARQQWSAGREWWYWRRPRVVDSDFEGD